MKFDIDAPLKFWPNNSPIEVKPYPKGQGGYFICNQEAPQMWFWLLQSLGYPVRLEKPWGTRRKGYMAIVMDTSNETAQCALNALLSMDKIKH